MKNNERDNYDATVRRLRGHFANCDGFKKIGTTSSGLIRLEFTYLRAMQPTQKVRMDVTMDQIEEAENNDKP